MLTKNFKNMMAMILTTESGAPGLLPVRDTGGAIRYYGHQNNTSSFPYYRYNSFTLNATSYGISFGSGTTPATEDDYCLESAITSGLSCSIGMVRALDNNGNPYVTFAMTVTNTSNTSITIGEIGYKQNLYCASANGGTSYGNYTCLIDHTILTTPITIAAGDYAVIEYTLKTIINSGS